MNRSVQEEAKELYEDREWSFGKIGQKLGYSRQAIYNVAVNNGWKIRTKKEAVAAKTDKVAVRMQELEPRVVELLNQGWSVKRIAGTLRLPIKTVKGVYDGLSELERKAISYKGSHRQISDEELDQYLIKVWEMMGKPSTPPSLPNYNKVRQGLKAQGVNIPHSMTYVKRSGSWQNAIEDTFRDLPVTIKRNPLANGEMKVYEAVDLLTDLRACHDDLQKLPSIQEYNSWRERERQDGRRRASSPTIMNRLFGWVNALKLLQDEVR